MKLGSGTRGGGYVRAMAFEGKVARARPLQLDGAAPLDETGEPSGVGSDLDLVQRVLDGDDQAERTFVERMVCIGHFVTRLNRTAQVAEASLADVRQEVFGRVWSNLHRYEGRAELEYWVLRFVRLTLHDFVRAEIRWRAAPRRVVETSSDLSFTAREAPCAIAIDRARLLERFGGSPAEIRGLLEARILEGASFQDLAARLRISVSAVKRRYYRALRRAQRRCRVR